MRRKITESEVYQEIDLAEIYGRDPTTEELVEFADAAKNEIIDRTQQGRDIDGNRFASYEKEYADFKGVSRNDVDLTLFGDMLDGLNTQVRGSRVFISMDQDQAAKAHGNIEGTYGQSSPIPGKARDFFGLREADARAIARQVQRVVNDEVLMEILGSAPLPDTPDVLDIREILSSIGLFGDES